METILTNPYHDVFTDKELEAITKFKTALTTDKEKDLVPQSLLADNDVLICFLRARKLDIAKSKKMIMDYLHWRIDAKVEDIYQNYQMEKKIKLLCSTHITFTKPQKTESLYIFKY